ncbi:ankyrin repeat domain-containing protein 34C-like [Lampetra fluviatilis]
MDECSELRMENNSLWKAVYMGRLRLSRLLLEGGAYINESNEKGETPLMMACRSKQMDSQSASKLKMVKYLLENKADPNIQDVSGKTALMHACITRAGSDVVLQLLQNSADPSLEDHSGASALVYAIDADDKETLKVLLDACKAKGKDVIIITTDKSASGCKTTKQYLNAPPSPNISDRQSEVTSPTNIELKTVSAPCATGGNETENIFAFKSNELAPLAPNDISRRGGVKRGGAKLPQLQRLKSEPWGLVAPSCSGQHNLAATQQDTLKHATAVDEMSSGINSLLAAQRHTLSRHHSLEVNDPPLRFITGEQGSSPNCSSAQASRKMLYEKNAGQPPRHLAARRNTLPVEEISETLAMPAASGLRDIIAHRLLGNDHYNSDTQLQAEPAIIVPVDLGKATLERRKHTVMLSNSRDSLDGLAGNPTMMPQHRHPSLIERRGSGTLLMDHFAHTRPGILPPINTNSSMHSISDFASTNKTNSPTAMVKPMVPTVPSSPNSCDAKPRKKIIRRHSMQVEQMRQLLTREEATED